MEGVKQTVDDAIASEPILVYSKSYCPHSQRAKRILGGLPAELGAEEGAGVPPMTVVELDRLGQLGADMQAYLAQLTGQRTVPNIFIHQKHVGGADDLSRLHATGVLREMILASSPAPTSTSRLFSSYPLHLKSLQGTLNYPMVMVCLVLFSLVGIGYRLKTRSTRVAPQKQKL